MKVPRINQRREYLYTVVVLKQSKFVRKIWLPIKCRKQVYTPKILHYIVNVGYHNIIVYNIHLYLLFFFRNDCCCSSRTISHVTS